MELSQIIIDILISAKESSKRIIESNVVPQSRIVVHYTHTQEINELLAKIGQ